MKYSWFLVLSILIISCNQNSARRPINKNDSSSKSNYSIELNKLIKAKEEKKIKDYIVKDSLLVYTYSPYGFAYAKIKSSNQLKNKINETSTVEYEKTVFNLKNNLIYNKIKETIRIGKSSEIKGIEEGVKLMQEDEEFKFIFSSFVSHGFSGDGNRIGANTPIVVKIKLLKINK